MKKVFWFGVVPFLALCTIGILLLQIDDDLNPNVIKWLDQLPQPTASQAFTYLLAIDAKEGVDPAAEGAQMLAKIKVAETTPEGYVTFDNDNKLALPKGKLFCTPLTSECLADLWTTPFDITAIKQENATLIARADHYFSLTDFQSLTKPSVVETIPFYKPLSIALRINTLQAIAMHKAGKPQQALAVLQQNMAKIRAQLAKQDTIIGKIVFLKKLNECMDVMNIIALQSKVDISPIAHLNTDEKNLEVAILREYATFYSLFKKMDKSPELLEKGGHMPGWVSRAIFKSNMTINALLPHHTRLLQLSKSTPVEFAQAAPETLPSSSSLRNYTGNVLISLTGNFDHFVGAFFDTDAKIDLFNHIIVKKLPATEMRNPYYPNQLAKTKDKQVCLDSPITKSETNTCVWIQQPSPAPHA
jgi:hypothetical protein